LIHQVIILATHQAFLQIVSINLMAFQTLLNCQEVNMVIQRILEEMKQAPIWQIRVARTKAVQLEQIFDLESSDQLLLSPYFSDNFISIIITFLQLYAISVFIQDVEPRVNVKFDFYIFIISVFSSLLIINEINNDDIVVLRMCEVNRYSWLRYALISLRLLSQLFVTTSSAAILLKNYSDRYDLSLNFAAYLSLMSIDNIIVRVMNRRHVSYFIEENFSNPDAYHFMRDDDDDFIDDELENLTENQLNRITAIRRNSINNFRRVITMRAKILLFMIILIVLVLSKVLDDDDNKL